MVFIHSVLYVGGMCVLFCIYPNDNIITDIINKILMLVILFYRFNLVSCVMQYNF